MKYLARVFFLVNPKSAKCMELISDLKSLPVKEMRIS